MAKTTDNHFVTLSNVPVRDKIERKGNLDYLSWANAWAMLKSHYPDAQRHVYESEHTGLNFFTDGKTAYVKVGITVNDIEHIDYLPVMDHRNNALPIDKVTSTDVNKTIQRSTAKAIAMHGLGLSLWTGEDVPETPAAPIERKELTKDSPELDKVMAYVVANKTQPFDALLLQVSKKYIVTAPAQKELEKAHKA
jgi:hypothetical protein